MVIWILSKRPEYENTRLLEEFNSAGMEAIVINPADFGLIIETGRHGISLNGQPVSLPQAVLVRTGSGTTAHAGAIMRQLEYFGIPVINAIESTEAAQDKVLTGQMLAASGVPMPKTLLVTFPISAEMVEKEIGFPCVIKVGTGSYGKGVHLCQSRQEFPSLMQMIEALDAKRSIIIQKYIANTFGTDLRVWVIGGEVICAMKRQGADGDFRANISAGGVGSLFPLDDRIIDIAGRATAALKLDIAGVDLLFTEDGYVVCELNSSAGFEGFERYCEINIARLIVERVAYHIACKPVKKASFWTKLSCAAMQYYADYHPLIAF